jgi:hypothetical protein
LLRRERSLLRRELLLLWKPALLCEAAKLGLLLWRERAMRRCRPRVEVVEAASAEGVGGFTLHNHDSAEGRTAAQ